MMTSNRRSVFTTGLLASLLLVSASTAVADPPTSPEPQTTVSGTIRYDDQPVRGVYVDAVLADEAGTVLASDTSDADGRYEIVFRRDTDAPEDRLMFRVIAPAGLLSETFPGGRLSDPGTVIIDYDLVQTGGVYFPSAGDQRDTLTPVVAWSWSEDASTYDVQILARERSRLLETVFEARGLSQTRWNVPPGVLEPGEQYVVRVFGKNARGTVVFRSEVGLIETTNH